MLTLWNIFEASLLCLNAVCVLHEERFMLKMGWGANSMNEDQSSVKFRILNLVRSIRTLLRIPLIPLNILTIIYKLLLE